MSEALLNAEKKTSATPADPGTQPKVFCQKGKCYPYDPARMKNPNLNLEMKPGIS